MKKITAEEFIAQAKEGKLRLKLIPEKEIIVTGKVELKGKYPNIVIDGYIFEEDVSLDHLVCEIFSAEGTEFKKTLSYENNRIRFFSIKNAKIGFIRLSSMRKCDI
jgi:hypothetical protein